MTIEEKLIDMIKEYQVINNLTTQKKIAEKLDINQSAFSAGIRKANLSWLTTVCNRLNIDIENKLK